MARPCHRWWESFRAELRLRQFLAATRGDSVRQALEGASPWRPRGPGPSHLRKPSLSESLFSLARSADQAGEAETHHVLLQPAALHRPGELHRGAAHRRPGAGLRAAAPGRGRGQGEAPPGPGPAFFSPKGRTRLRPWCWAGGLPREARSGFWACDGTRAAQGWQGPSCSLPALPLDSAPRLSQDHLRRLWPPPPSQGLALVPLSRWTVSPALTSSVAALTAGGR